jgi:hypothetical protein
VHHLCPHDPPVAQSLVLSDGAMSTLDSVSKRRAESEVKLSASKRHFNAIIVAIIMVAVPGEVNQLGIIGLTGATYTGHTISPWDKCCFRFCNSGNIPRKMLDCGMIVPRFPFIDVGWYQLRGFNDVDNNVDVLKKHYARKRRTAESRMHAHCAMQQKNETCQKSAPKGKKIPLF